MNSYREGGPNMSDHIRAHLIITGRVQGVCFRMETMQAAQRHNTNGWVRNLPDRSVEALLEGPAEAVNQTIEWCRHGPPHSRVENVQVQWEDYQGEFNRFSITY